MSIFHKKDDFGRTIYKIPVASILFWGFLVFTTLFVWSIGCSKFSNGDEFTKEIAEFPTSDEIEAIKEEVETDPAELVRDKKDRVPIKKKQNDRLRYGIKKIGVVKLYATCYSQFDGPIEMKGIYANNDMADRLHRRERRIQRNHYTVALPPELDNYHRELVQLPDGTWTHKYRFHVPGYNPEGKPVCRYGKRADTDTILSVINHEYFSVPRDRVQFKGRIDCLFTTAGKYSTIEERQLYWARKDTHNLPVEVWELEDLK